MTLNLNVIRPDGTSETLVQVVDGKPVIVPPSSAPQTPASAPAPASAAQ